MLLLGRRHRSQKPSGTPILDRAAPLAAGLRAFFPCTDNGGVPRDLVRPRVPTTSGTWAYSQRGINVRDAKARADAMVECDFTSGPWTVAAYGRLEAAVGNAVVCDFFGRFDYVSESNNQGWILQALGGSHSTESDKFVFTSLRNNASTSYRLASTTAQAAGHWLLVGTSDGTTRKLYVNGKLEASTGNNANPITVTTEGFGVPFARNSSGTAGRTYWAAAWARCLRPEDVWDLWTFGPDLLLAPPRRPYVQKPPTFTQAVGDTLAPTEALRRAILATRPETIGLTEGQTIVLNPFDFDRTIEVSNLLDGRQFEFLRTLQVIQPALPDFDRTIFVRAQPLDFDRRLRVIPNVQTPFADDVQMPVGKVTTE